MDAPTPYQGREAEFTRTYVIFNQDTPGPIPPGVATPVRRDSGVGNRVLLRFDYHFIDSNPLADTDIIDFEVEPIGLLSEFRTQDPAIPASYTAADRTYALLDVYPTAHPGSTSGVRLNTQWAPIRLPNPRGGKHPFERPPAQLATTPMIIKPAVILTSVADYFALAYWFHARGGDAVTPELKAGEWILIMAEFGGLAGTM